MDYYKQNSSSMSEDSDYLCTLDQASIKKAKDELNENPQDRLAAVQALRDWVEEQPHIKYPDVDTATLLRFLRGAKFSQLRARELFENNLTIRTEYPKWYRDLDTTDPALVKQMKLGTYLVLPNRTKNGEKIVLERLATLEKVVLDIPSFLRFATILFEYLMSEEMTQVNGVVFMHDFTGVGLKLLKKFTGKEMSEFEKKWMKNTPGRYKALHFYNAGLVFEAVMAFAKPFMPKKWINRIKVHNTLETLYKEVPMESLPVEYLPDDYTGPNAGKVDDLVQQFTDELQKPAFRNMLLQKTSADYCVTGVKPAQEEVTEHFRKLNVD